MTHPRLCAPAPCTRDASLCLPLLLAAAAPWSPVLAATRVPPLAGHPQPLRTIVDVVVTRHARVYCGSGKTDVDVGVAVADMLQHTRAEVVAVAVGSRPSVEAKLQEAAALLPLPWAPGAEMVRMIGVVAQRRR